ncbi:MAG: hypothetical protein COB35_01330 [Gammaproteobacteria bacterium]|nr:MAG: hypothetical protein COB35_01330 [Gammaproteobacteria bacterium]
MADYIYNMGLPILVKHEQVVTKKKIKPLSASARSSALGESGHSIILDEFTAPEAISRQHSIFNQAYQQHSNNHRQMVIHADEIMSTPVMSLPQSSSFAEVWQQFQQQQFRHFTVVDKENRLVGIISDRDMLNSPHFEEQQGQLNHPDRSIHNTMIRRVFTASTKTNIREICQLMFRKHIGAVPIVNDNGQVDGLITRSDILRTIIKNEPLEFWV